nr:F-box incomplete domain containing protein [Pandoravirus belohorizontensis]
MEKERDAAAAGFDCLPDELVAATLACLDPVWRPLARMVCRRWAEIAGAPSRAQVRALRRSRPANARPEAWIGGRVLCATAITRALVTDDADARGVLSVPSAAAAWCLRAFPSAPPGDVACALSASGRADAIAHALDLVEGDAVARSRVVALGAHAAVRADRVDAVDVLLTQCQAPLAHTREGTPGTIADLVGKQRPWTDDLWLWVARHDAARVAAHLLDVTRSPRGAYEPLRDAWHESNWPEAAGLVGADGVVAVHIGRGVFSPPLADRVGAAAAAGGHVRTCALVVRSLRDHATRGQANNCASVSSDDRNDITGAGEMAVDRPSLDSVIAKMGLAAGCGHAPDAVLDWMEHAIGHRPDRRALMGEAVKWGPRCGRGALALIVRWPETGHASPLLAACAIGRAVLRTYLDDADRAVAALHAFGTAARVEPARQGGTLWDEIVLDMCVSGLTGRTALDTLALVCALAARCGHGDPAALTAALAIDRDAEVDGTRCRPQWARVTAESAEAWAPWCRPRPVASASVQRLLRRVEPRRGRTAAALAAWLSAAGLLVDRATSPLSSPPS